MQRRAVARGAAIGAILAAAGLGGLAAAGQTPAAAPPPAATPAVSAEPATTSASYGDWVLRCQRVGDGTAARRLCEVAQAVRLPQGRDPVAEVALGHIGTERAFHITVLVPTNIVLPSTPTIGAGDKPAPSADLQWRRCVPIGCLADAAATDDLVKAWRAGAIAGRLAYKDGAGRDIALPLSFRGLAQALDALDKG